MPPIEREPVTAADARDNLSDLINRAAYAKERVVLTRRGKPLAALVPLDDMKLLEEIEDSRDAADIRKRLAAWERGGRKGIPLETVAKTHGVKLAKRRGVSR
ncbi:MAG: type II toxin-antitoxin system Phd/YefM family antitoxin [Rhodospirillaceae bacterium]|nr:type II toxin-antitoxin system Phd/YefM family antitoxin [Rhodospirillaceae bacterium]